MFDNDNISIFSKADVSPTPTTSAYNLFAMRNHEQRSQPKPTRHNLYHFDPVVFRVEGVLFKVPKHEFMVPGSMFYDMFSRPIPEGKEPEGSDSNPIDLPLGITPQEFFGFLYVLYPYLGNDNIYDEIKYEELVGALKLATMWHFPKVRKGAIFLLSHIEKLRDPVEIVLLAKQYRVKSLLYQGYTRLVNHEHTMQTLRTPPFQLDWESISGIFATKMHFMEKHAVKFTEGRAEQLSGSDDSDTWDISRRSSYELPSENSLKAYLDFIFEEELKQMEDDADLDISNVEPIFQRHISTIMSKNVSQQPIMPPENRQDDQTTSDLSPASTLDPKHHTYYLDMMSIRVDDTLYSVPKTIASHSNADYFEQFHLTSRHAGMRVTARSFSRFLSVLYPIEYNPESHYDQRPEGYAYWMDVLHVSTRWEFSKIRERSIAALSGIIKKRNPVETVLTARRYKVKSWLLDALVELGSRPGSDMVQELREPFDLDWKTIAKVLSIRCRSRRIPDYLRRPRALCTQCKSSDGTSGKRGKAHSCKFSCKKLEFPDDDAKDLKFMLTRSVPFAKLPESMIRAMVVKDFGDEFSDWPI